MGRQLSNDEIISKCELELCFEVMFHFGDLKIETFL